MPATACVVGLDGAPAVLLEGLPVQERVRAQHGRDAAALIGTQRLGREARTSPQEAHEGQILDAINLHKVELVSKSPTCYSTLYTYTHKLTHTHTLTHTYSVCPHTHTQHMAQNTLTAHMDTCRRNHTHTHTHIHTHTHTHTYTQTRPHSYARGA
jgi:hypothetical protein